MIAPKRRLTEPTAGEPSDTIIGLKRKLSPITGQDVSHLDVFESFIDLLARAAAHDACQAPIALSCFFVLDGSTPTAQVKDMRLCLVEDEIVLDNDRTVREYKLDATDGSILALIYADSTVESGWESVEIHDPKNFESQNEPE